MHDLTTLPQSSKQDYSSKMHPAPWWRSALHRSIAMTLWGLGLLVLASASLLVHNHPGPWPGELAFSRTIQGLHYGSWIAPLLDFIGTFNNPTPSGMALGIIFTAILLLGWYRQAIFLALTTAAGNGIDTFFGDYVGRPRPSPSLVRVDVLLKYNSFPSGHCCNEVLLYGFLLYLSFTKPVRAWRYRWALIPLQVFAALNILLIGISRVYEGEHWTFDVLAGYLSGALWLALFIFLYQWTTSVLERRRVKKAARRPTAADEMQPAMTRRRSPAITAVVVLLSIQGLLGLLFSLPRIADLLAPGRPVIVSGAAIFTGPAGGISLVMALASLFIAWGFWKLKPWAHPRAVLLQGISLAIGAFELIEPGVSRGVPLTRIIIAALILICLYVPSSTRAMLTAKQSDEQLHKGTHEGLGK